MDASSATNFFGFVNSGFRSISGYLWGNEIFWICFLYLDCFNQVKGIFDFRFLAAEFDFLAQGTAGSLFHISTRTGLEIGKA